MSDVCVTKCGRDSSDYEFWLLVIKLLLVLMNRFWI